MIGLAKKRFLEKQRRPLPKSCWPFIQELLEKGLLKPIDVEAAKRFFSDHEEERALFFATCVMAGRLGHICIEIYKDCLAPALSELFLEEEKLLEEWERRALLGSEGLEIEALKREGNRVYLKRNHFFESNIISGLKRFEKMPREKFDKGLLEGLSLNPKQKEAVSQVFNSERRITLISGGPGTGKTFTTLYIIKSFIEFFPEKRAKILLTAPTGKAVALLEKRFLENPLLDPSRVEMEFKTLHSLLQVRNSEDFLSDGISLFADLMIVDESSMIELRLWARLFQSLNKEARLVLLGDKNQLPPVESGNIFMDFCESSSFFPHVHLTECKRQEESMLVEIAEAVCSGDAAAFEAVLDNPCSSFQFIDYSKESVDEILKPVVEKFSLFFEEQNLPQIETAFEALEKFCLLSPLRKSFAGFEHLNRAVYEKLSQERGDLPYLAVPIILKQTDYKLGLNNGEIGILMCASKKGEADQAFFKDHELKTFPASMLPPFDYAYALSVHKSQGCEYEEVLIFFPEGAEVFGRQILYTALTRAKKRVKLCGERKALLKCVSQEQRRLSGIKERIYTERDSKIGFGQYEIS